MTRDDLISALRAERDRLGERLSAIDRVIELYEIDLYDETALAQDHALRRAFEIPKVDGGRQYTTPKPDGLAKPQREPVIVPSCWPADDAEAIPAETMPVSSTSREEEKIGIPADRPSAKEEPAPAVAINVHSPEAARPEAKHIPNAWTAAELETATRIVRDGGTQTDVFNALDGARSKSACKTMCIRLRKQMAEEGPAATPSHCDDSATAMPAPAQPEPEAPPQYRTGPWSDDEIMTAQRMLDDGTGGGVIAKALGRHVGPTNILLSRLRKEAEEHERGSEPAEPVEQDGGGTEEVGPLQNSRLQVGEDCEASGTEKAAPAPVSQAHGTRTTPVETIRLNLPKTVGLGASVGKMPLPDLVDGWTRARDLALVEAIVGGMKIAAWAGKNGVMVDAAKERFWAYCGKPPTLDGQSRALRVLRAIAEPQVAAE